MTSSRYRPSGINAATATLSSPDELPDNALDNSLRAVAAEAAEAVISGRGDREALRKKLLDQRKKLLDQHVLTRVFHAFTDGGNTVRQDIAACVLIHHATHKDLAHAIICLCGSPQRFISSLAPLLTETDHDGVATVTLALLRMAMTKGREEGNAADYRDHCVQHHPAVFGKAVALAGKIAGERSMQAVNFLLSAFSPDGEFGPPFPGPSAVSTLVWVGLFRVVVRVLTCEDQETRDEFFGRGVSVTALIKEHITSVAHTGSNDDHAAYLAAMDEHVYEYVDTMAATLTSRQADRQVRAGAAVCLMRIFDFCSEFANAAEIGPAYLATLSDGPVQRLMRVPKALQAYAAAAKDLSINMAACSLASTWLVVPQMLAACGHRDAVYSSGCISMASDTAKRLDKRPLVEVAPCAAALQNIVGRDTDLTDVRAKIAVRDGLPGVLCDVAHACIKGGHIDQQKVNEFIDFAVRNLQALVSYGDRVSSRGGKFRPNSVTQAILQHEAVKTMRAAAARPPARRKGHQQQQQQQLTVPKKLLDLFDEIESAASKRAERLIAELDIEGTQEGAEDTNGSKGVKKKSSKGKRGGKGASTKESPSPSSCGANNVSEDHSERQDEDTEEHDGLPGPPGPSPPSPPRPSYSYSSSSASAAGGTSVSVGGGHGQQQGAGGGGDDGGGFLTVGRKRRGGKGTGAHTQQQTNIADKPVENSGVFPSSSSSESTRPSSSQSSVSGGPRNAPAVPFPLPPRPAAPPPQPPNRHTYTPTPTPAPSSSRGGSDEQGLAPSAAGGSSSSTLERAVEVEGRGGQHRCGGGVSELDALHQQLEAMRVEKEAMQRTNEAILKEIKREKERLEESTECDICMAEKKSIVLIPCRHFCLCGVCCGLDVQASGPAAVSPVPTGHHGHSTRLSVSAGPCC
ncbi:unnamed protein product [Vitrella brassicaformis CCMP3155]|uniref:Uncharacterized protein n=2 Tax=Vitrella brassicaformis TaxID=1169539 RepID=A0A0G4H3W7_VITBC|nr:unnamed protein product [Vitrella brassicaformis CCMP3155]|eukprot:CEM38399.1 unnamed protein product [Vitrella brassicaformis CCMP3155]